MFYIKTTETCNLDCHHCFTSGKNGRRIFFDPEVTAKWCNDLLKIDNRPCHFEFHGGEPFLAELGDMWRFYEMTKHNQSTYGMTSNLVLKLSPAKMRFVKTVLNNRIGTSWDPKIRFQNEKQQELWESNVLQLVNAGVDVKVFVSMTRDTINIQPIRLLRYFKELGIKEVAFERLTKNGYAKENLFIFPSNLELQQWFLRLHEQTKQYDARDWIVNEFLESVYAKFELGASAQGTFCRNCEQKMFTINADGTIAGCPNSAPEDHYADLSMTPFEVLNLGQRCSIIAKEQQRDPRCYECPMYKYCNGDCHQLDWEDDICAAPKLLMKELHRERLDGCIESS